MKLSFSFLQNSLVGTILALFLFTSCSYPDKPLSEENTVTPQLSEASELRYSITHGKTLGESWDSYYALANSQRHALWADKLDHTKGFFTGQQDELDFLDDAMVGLENNDFDKESSIDDSEIIADAQLIFSDADIYKIFMVLHDYNDTPDPWRPNSGDPQPDCVCRWSMGCGGGLCESLGCSSSVSGCGFLWMSSCTGLCDNSPY